MTVSYRLMLCMTVALSIYNVGPGWQASFAHMRVSSPWVMSHSFSHTGEQI